jgi:hypothetical protein
MTFVSMPPPGPMMQVEAECYVCNVTITSVAYPDSRSVKRRHSKYVAHYRINHPGFGERGRTLIADAMLKHERRVVGGVP